MNDIFCRNPLALSCNHSRTSKLVVARVIPQKVVSHRPAPLVNLDAHSDTVAVCLNARVVIVQQISLEHLKAKWHLAVTKLLVDQPDENFTRFHHCRDRQPLDFNPAQLPANMAGVSACPLIPLLFNQHVQPIIKLAATRHLHLRLMLDASANHVVADCP